MTSVASQIVFHPTVSQSLRFGGTNLGRDKLYRAIQYWARFYAWWLLSKGDKEGAVRWTALKSHLGTARKLMRLGKPMEHLQLCLRAAMTSSPPVEQITTIGRQIGYFGYLTLDAFVWVNSVNFYILKPGTAQKLAKTSNRFWLVGILFSVVHGIFKGARLIREAESIKRAKRHGEKDLAEEAEREARLRAINIARVSLSEQMLMDLLDVWIPATGAGLVDVNEGILGIAGLTTSLMAIKKQWKVVGAK